MSDKPEAAVEREDTAHAEGAAAIEAPMPHTEAGSEPESAETFNARPEDFPPEAEEQERSEVAPHETPREAEPGYVETPSRPEPQRHHPQQQRRHPQGYVRHPEHHEPRPQPRHPAVADAIQQVNEIIQTLKDSLDDMDEVLETLELAERQKNFDEQEIESLKRALRGLQRPREQGRGQQREHS